MNNEITIDPEGILLLPDNSITDAETIRQIGLFGDKDLYPKIKRGFEFAALYPHMMQPFKLGPDPINDWEKKQDLEAFNIKDLNEAFEWMKNSIADYDEFAKLDEKTGLAMAHHGVGRWLRNTLGFWADLKKPLNERRPLIRWFNAKGIYHPDDMSSILLTSFHRYLNNKEVLLYNQIQHYIEYWEKTDPKVNEGKLG